MTDASPTDPRHPRKEAEALVGPAWSARVLEPSPPAVDAPPWFADDPASPAPDDGRPVVAPVAGGARTWDALARERPEIAAWCAERWLGAWRLLAPPPPGLRRTWESLHRLAVYAISPARREANGKIALRWTLGGIGTPFFAEDRQVRAFGDRLVVQRGDRAEVAQITSLSAAADLIGVALDREAESRFDVPPLGDPDAPLDVDPAASRWLGDWYGLAASVLEEVRVACPDAPAARLQLWPEHGDLAVDLGDADAGGRATYGASPGDGAHPEPYLYVLPWRPVRDDPFFAATAFAGAELTLARLLDAPDPHARALEFLRAGRARLAPASASAG